MSKTNNSPNGYFQQNGKNFKNAYNNKIFIPPQVFKKPFLLFRIDYVTNCNLQNDFKKTTVNMRKWKLEFTLFKVIDYLRKKQI